jgi:hypothetical protein
MPHSSSSSHALRISPKELNFPPPFNRMISSVLTIHNSSADHAVAYKVKTTAPQRYCVRPNTGLLPPGDTVEVQVLLNHTKDAPNVDAEDKFQIQSIILKESFNDIKEVWAKASPDQVFKQKLKAKFTPAVNKGVSSSREDHSEKKVAEGDHVLRGEEIHTGRSVPVVTFQLPAQTTPITATPEVAAVIQPEALQILDVPVEYENTLAVIPAISTPNTTPSPSLPVPAVRPTVSVSSPSAVVDVHANLRKALDQVVSLTSAKENISAQNRELTHQVNTLQKMIADLQEKTHNHEATTVRQRTTQIPQITSTTNDPSIRYRPQSAANGNRQLIIVVIVILFAFFLGRWTV